ncbi:hypothetical protein RSOL_447650 [Rhizoctonia solani AG-3 Rhs1AP]|uniref:DUF7918 domain-containing protein n=1 Tax=Rhizoctonia solani AG-3 Rhs1AP TaxID=1086054 RepID=X8JRA7_9AGAM|nr:hypothetical protein RSOL_447650 [Rhizoctonia solani AG-3 Rhs1AP]
MRFEKHGLLVQITDVEDNALTEYQVEETADNTIQCWIPSTEGSNFKIRCEIVSILYPGHDLRTTPFLDGVQMSGLITPETCLFEGYSYQHYRQLTGSSTARLYEFGKRTLTDSDDCAKPNESILKDLNTIKLKLNWGNRGELVPCAPSAPQEIGAIHEKAAKKGHSGAAKLGKVISVPTVSTTVGFTPANTIALVTFVFSYAPEGWLRARGIIPRSQESESQGNPRDILKRERSTTPDIIDIDDLETDDDEIQIIKHMVPASVANNKRQRVERRDAGRPKKEEA